MANGPSFRIPNMRGTATEEMILKMFFQCGFQSLDLKTLLEDGLLQPVLTLST